MIKRLIFTTISILLAFSSTAKTMEEIWSAMPDSIIPYIDHTHRLEMTDFIKMGLKGDVDHSLGGKSEMDTITSDYIHLTLNESVTMELKRLPWEGHDSLVCVVTTWKGPAEESKVKFYTQEWRGVVVPNAFDGGDFPMLASRLTQRPDTMSEDRYAHLRAMIDPVMLSAKMSVGDDGLRVSLSLPLLEADDQRLLEPIMKPVELHWDGRSFKSKLEPTTM